MLAAEIIARLRAEVPALGGRVEGAASFAAMLAGSAPPQVGRMAHVIPGGIVGRDVQPLTGIYRQHIDRLAEVILTVNAGQAKGVQDDVEDLMDAVILALVGWHPTDAFGPVAFRRLQLLSAKAGVFSWQMTFSAPYELRKYP